MSMDIPIPMYRLMDRVDMQGYTAYMRPEGTYSVEEKWPSIIFSARKKHINALLGFLKICKYKYPLSTR